ncbi:tetratricopeptide repeat protein [Geothrix sp. 21YS21S-2]|uniref:tetratricopeptide repeat protein n=1 Tax=Geothrix sp. 21YS21S-2 TaxID=3068893 RepID=UPI0027B8D460|nr:tetratricopeptide repeat protein [Geothrix sp. 21YS21S-2]
MHHENPNPLGRWLIGLAMAAVCVPALLALAGRGPGPQAVLVLLGLALASAGAGAVLWNRPGAAEEDPANRLELAIRRVLARFRGSRDEVWYRWGLAASHRGTAVAFLEEAARLGHPEAHFELGLFYEEGGMGQAGREVAARHYRSAAEAGHAEASFRLAELLRWGIGPSRDPGAAQRWYLRSANDGFRPAMDWLSRAYEFGEDLPEDLEMAVYWTMKARAAEPVGLRISHFARTRRFGPRASGEITRGWDATIEAIATADPDRGQACFRMGMSFLGGTGGKPRDPEAAKRWLQRAAEAGHVEAMAELGELLAPSGDARAWFQRAGAAGHQGAQIRLGQLEVPD